MDGYFQVEKNDLIGWTSEGCIVPISCGDTGGHFTYYSDVITRSDSRRVGLTYTFDMNVLLTFSVAVSIEQRKLRIRDSSEIAQVA